MSEERPATCPSCGADTPDRGVYCGQCGEPLLDVPGGHSTPKSDESSYVCLNCGAEYDTHDPPCHACASERVVAIAADDGIDTMADVTFECQQCGATAPRNSPPCKDCGGMDFKPVEDSEPATQSADGGVATAREWIEPGPQHTFVNPRGPFRPLRRWLWYAVLASLLGSFVGGLLAGASGSGVLLALVIYYSVAIFPWLVVALLAFWLIDTVLSYLKG